MAEPLSRADALQAPLGGLAGYWLHVRCGGCHNAVYYASRDELLACLDHLLAAAGNQSLMTSELRVTLADHAAGNYRILMNLADELLAVAADRELPRLDEKLFLGVFAQTPKPETAAAAARKR